MEVAIIRKQLFIFAYALTGLIDHDMHEDHVKIVNKLNEGKITQYLEEKYASRMPLMSKANFSAVNHQIVQACGGDATIYLKKYPRTTNGLVMLMNMVINAIWVLDSRLISELSDDFCDRSEAEHNVSSHFSNGKIFVSEELR